MTFIIYDERNKEKQTHARFTLINGKQCGYVDGGDMVAKSS